MGGGIKFYVDEHVPPAVTYGLRRRSVDVLTTQEAGMLGQDDDSQLRLATGKERVVFTQDADFLALHNKGIEHAGIAYAPQQTPIGEIVRGLLLIHDILTPEEMRGRLEFI
jgi:hypothetical protein